METNKDLELYRKLIDRIDSNIVECLKIRFLAVKEISEIKKNNSLPVENKDREKIIFDKLNAEINDEELYPYFEKIFLEIINESKEYQKKD